MDSPFLRFFDKYIRLLDYTFRSFYGNSRRKQEEAIHLVPLPDANESDVDESSDEELDDDCDMDYVESETEEEVIESDGSTGEGESDSGQEEQEDNSANGNKAKKRKTNTNDKIEWKKNKRSLWEIPDTYIPHNEKLKLDPGVPLTRFSAPMNFFELFVNGDLIDFIYDQTKLYNEWRRLKNGTKPIKSITKEEIKKVIGIVLHMGIVKLPNRRMYWAPDTRNELIAESMSRNRFDEIMTVLHYNDNNELPEKNSPLYNKCYKIQPLVDHFRKVFKQFVLPETHMSIDEQVVPFKGQHSLKRYLPKKPKKWGYKIWARAGISGYVYDFEIEGGLGSKGPPDDCVPPEKCGESDFVVLRLSAELEPLKHELFFDNYFSSPELIRFLAQEKKIWTVATLNMKRSRNCPILSEKEMGKKGRGWSQEVVDTTDTVVVTAWFDNKRVLTISNFAGKEPVDTCKRFDRKERKKIDVDRTKSVAIYNKFMGGVDKADMLLSLYRTRFRCRKWYNRLAFHMFSLAAVNSWLLYREIGGHATLVKFLAKICFSMIKGSAQRIEMNEEEDEPEQVYRSMRANDVPSDIKHDKYDHWPVMMDIQNSQRCKNEDCKKKTKYQCSKCHIYLCLANNRCFREYHGVYQ